jgi:hypothetical protein
MSIRKNHSPTGLFLFVLNALLPWESTQRVPSTDLQRKESSRNLFHDKTPLSKTSRFQNRELGNNHTRGQLFVVTPIKLDVLWATIEL